MLYFRVIYLKITKLVIFVTNFDGKDLRNFLALFQMPSAGCFREEVENVKIWF